MVVGKRGWKRPSATLAPGLKDGEKGVGIGFLDGEMEFEFAQ